MLVFLNTSNNEQNVLCGVSEFLNFIGSVRYLVVGHRDAFDDSRFFPLACRHRAKAARVLGQPHTCVKDLGENILRNLTALKEIEINDDFLSSMTTE